MSLFFSPHSPSAWTVALLLPSDHANEESYPTSHISVQASSQILFSLLYVVERYVSLHLICMSSSMRDSSTSRVSRRCRCRLPLFEATTPRSAAKLIHQFAFYYLCVRTSHGHYRSA
ncbi:hypothetical protein B0H11DRAFT_2207737 [Mycena galericulata]|nr:hypothetical protein B0H11DRAFT_2207737 [Mycena galericulata]